MCVYTEIAGKASNGFLKKARNMSGPCMCMCTPLAFLWAKLGLSLFSPNVTTLFHLRAIYLGIIVLRRWILPSAILVLSPARPMWWIGRLMWSVLIYISSNQRVLSYLKDILFKMCLQKMLNMGWSVFKCKYSKGPQTKVICIVDFYINLTMDVGNYLKRLNN